MDQPPPPGANLPEEFTTAYLEKARAESQDSFSEYFTPEESIGFDAIVAELLIGPESLTVELHAEFRGVIEEVLRRDGVEVSDSELRRLKQIGAIGLVWLSLAWQDILQSIREGHSTTSPARAATEELVIAFDLESEEELAE